MNGSAKRLMAVMLASVMVASAIVVVLTDEQDSSATTNNSFYYSFLDDGQLSKNLYTKLNDLDAFDASVTVSYSSTDLDAIAALGGDTAAINTYLDSQLPKAIDAWYWDDPERNYYFTSYGISYNSTQLTFTPTTFDSTTFSGTKSTVDDRLSGWITTAASTIDSSGTEYQTIKNIHDYVTDSLSYDTVHVESDDYYWRGTIRSVYTSFSDDGETGHKVVCEGYAKMFKKLCDHFGVECIIVTGLGNGSGGWEAHMWNYVKYNDKWFVVDCTFDDTGGTSNYLLAGSETTGSTHNPCGINTPGTYEFYTTFCLPELNAYSVAGDGSVPTGPTHTVTFKVGDDTYRTISVADGSPVAYPGEPERSGWNFIEWRLSDSETAYDFSSPVTEDLTIVANMTEKQVYRLRYVTVEGSIVQSTVVEKPEGEGNPPVKVSITNSVPIKEGYKFKEWNTSKNGKGVSYNGGDEITLVGDGTLYAIWEDTNSVTFKIDNLMAQAAEFLSKETIPGVSNFLLTIGVITTVVSLIAVIAIARK